MKTFSRIKQKLINLKEKICVATADRLIFLKRIKKGSLEDFKLDEFEFDESPLTRYEHNIEFTEDKVSLYINKYYFKSKLNKDNLRMIKYFKNELNFNISGKNEMGVGWRMIGSIKDCFNDNKKDSIKSKVRYYNYIDEEDRRNTIQTKWNKRRLERSLGKKDTVEKKNKI